MYKIGDKIIFKVPEWQIEQNGIIWSIGAHEISIIYNRNSAIHDNNIICDYTFIDKSYIIQKDEAVKFKVDEESLDRILTERQYV